MNRISTFLLLAFLPMAGLVQADRPPINDKKAPDNRKDLEAIQSALMEALPKAREATVCVDLGEGSGSGVIVSEDGLVLTAAHVSTAVGKELTIVLEDGTRLKAEGLGLVASTDAAMIQILEEGPFPFAEVDRLDSARLGDWVFSLGHSGGFDQDRGSVVRLGRLVRIAGSTFQTDCILIGGDSGGPLFDLAGRVIGIHSRVGQHKLVNMHVPAKEFVTHWDRMLASEFIGEGPFASKPVKGSGFLGLASESAADRDGLLVTRVGEDSPAAAAGIEVGDIILKVNGQEVNERGDLQAILQELAAGDKLEIDLLRAEEPQTINLRLGAR